MTGQVQKVAFVTFWDIKIYIIFYSFEVMRATQFVFEVDAKRSAMVLFNWCSLRYYRNSPHHCHHKLNVMYFRIPLEYCIAMVRVNLQRVRATVETL